MTTRVILVRHGQSTYNAQQRIQGRLDHSVLTEQGKADAKLVATALQDLPLDAIYSSPLQRARQTAEEIVAHLGSSLTIESPETLLEVDLPLWQGMLRKEVQTQFAQEYQVWKQQPEAFKMVISTPEGSKEHYPVLAMHEQAKRFWQDLLAKHQGQTVLVVAHNGINRCLLSTALNISPAYYQSILQSNCGISVLNFAGGWGEEAQLESMNLTNHLGVALPKFNKPEGIRLLLVRHGETQWNRDKRFQGVKDIPLNETGKEQGRKAGEFLKDVHLDFAVSSPLLRPKETAELILEAHPEVELQLNPLLAEISHGLWEGMLESEIEADYPGMLAEWQNSPETVQMPEGENLQQVWDRAIAAWSRILESAKPGTTGIVAAHDAINKAIVCHLFDLDPQYFWNFKQGNGAVTVIDYPYGAQGKPILKCHNITSHLNSGILDRTAAGAL
ncbi:MAG: histidine phosphatase family protein [Roseofilum sp. SBFL]|uniref:histidine phosphatase family protein n=1 Tax=unclassified Roseofilum TaxID=2620099 RepID=UPI001B2CAE3F|nr:MULTISPECIES: histidine phosphatase family protein [unclassified Roseofilum]MBP0012637.1 histidine phosphatase family protein [Roseofilum sp. SID3]MBP0023141.1 histidine phosphatase family protein [Roseofilum sp. SID2]MBP0039947.1 histidine phosphatase family protein [Roseofilum sp. SID1]MBP0042292.1 histidine phosphatase family protein [Roseofilum sp. SBFL]